jgi:hypothetical protein
MDPVQGKGSWLMKDCFGVHLGWFGEDNFSDVSARRKCYECEDFEACSRMMLVRTINGLRLEMRAGVRGLRNSLGGSHSEFPFG